MYKLPHELQKISPRESKQTLAKKKKKKKVDTCGCKNSDLENVYYTEIKANVYHKLEKKGKAPWLLLALEGPNSKIQDFRKLGKFKKIAEILGFDRKHAADYPKSKF